MPGSGTITTEKRSDQARIHVKLVIHSVPWDSAHETGNPIQYCGVPGDGIGPEVTAAGIRVLETACARAGAIELDFRELDGGAEAWRRNGVALTDEALRVAESADAILFGAMGLPDVRYKDGTEIAPQLDLRFALELYAGIRPIRSIPGVKNTLADTRGDNIDLVVIRESTEGLFASRRKGIVENDAIARDTMVITRDVCERVFDVGYNLARQRKQRGSPGRVTCVDKANVLVSQAFFRKVFDERAAQNPDILSDHHYVDATALDLIRKPWEFDVMIMENQYGDIISDLAAALIGGMGMAPSADLGDHHGMFQPSHGSAPDIAGTGVANPIAMILSTAMMLQWLGSRHQNDAAAKAGSLIESATRLSLGGGIRPMDLGGSHNTDAVTAAIINNLNLISLS